MIRLVATLGIASLIASAVIACDRPGATERQKEETATERAERQRAEADENARSAQQTQARDIAAARADFDKAREDYRHSRWVDLSDLDKKITDVQAKDQKATGKVRTDLDGKMSNIRTMRADFVRNLEALDRATPATWDTDRANLDKQWDQLKDTVDNAD